MKYGSPKKLKAIDIKTMPYPGFPTDMQSIMAATFTIAKGTTVVENIEYILRGYEDFDKKIRALGGNIEVSEVL